MKWQKLDTESGAPLWFCDISHVRNISFGVLINAGSRDEIWPEEAGLAHAVEHMLFEGTNCTLKTQKALALHIEEVGGAMNASTGSEEILYHHQITHGEIERSIRALGESIGSPAFPEHVIKPQLNVVLQEVCEDNDEPSIFLFDAWNRKAFGTHPLARLPRGLVPSIKRFRRKDFLRFWGRFLCPTNFTYLAVGKADKNQLVDLINRYFKAGNAPKNIRREIPAPHPPKKTLILKRGTLERAYVISGALLGPAMTKEFLALKFFSFMLSSGMSSPFYEELREKTGYCYSASASVEANSDVSTFTISISAEPKTWEEAVKLALEIVNREKTNEALLERVKEIVAGRLDLIDSTMEILEGGASHISFLGSPKTFTEIEQIYSGLSVADIDEAVNRYLDPKRFFTSVLLPK